VNTKRKSKNLEKIFKKCSRHHGRWCERCKRKDCPILDEYRAKAELVRKTNYTHDDICKNTRSCPSRVPMINGSNGKVEYVCTWTGYCFKRVSIRGTGHFETKIKETDILD
jgi:hypothetical protein